MKIPKLVHVLLCHNLNFCTAVCVITPEEFYGRSSIFQNYTVKSVTKVKLQGTKLCLKHYLFPRFKN